MGGCNPLHIWTHTILGILGDRFTVFFAFVFQSYVTSAMKPLSCLVHTQSMLKRKKKKPWKVFCSCPEMLCAASVTFMLSATDVGSLRKCHCNHSLWFKLRTFPQRIVQFSVWNFFFPVGLKMLFFDCLNHEFNLAISGPHHISMNYHFLKARYPFPNCSWREETPSVYLVPGVGQKLRFGTCLTTHLVQPFILQGEN